MSTDNLSTLNKILLDCIESIDRESKTTEELANIYGEMETFCSKNGFQKSEALKKLKSFIFCAVCQRNIGQVILECKHFLCESCLKNTVARQTNGLILLNQFESNNSPVCPDKNCSHTIKPACYKPLFDKNLEELELNCRQREIDKLEIKLSRKMCANCNKFRKLEHFFFNCRHICLFCQSFDFNLYIYCCRICQEQNESEIFTKSISNVKCNKCEDTQFFQNFFMEVCDDYILCVNCLKEYWRNINCLKCKKGIHFHENFEFVKNHLFKACDCCQNYVTVDFITELSCCPLKICFFCIVLKVSDSNESIAVCPECNTSVGPDVADVISKIYSNNDERNKENIKN